MCKPFSRKMRVLIRGKIVRLDPCLVGIVGRMKSDGIRTVSSCCGHGLFMPTIFYREGNTFREYFSGKRAFPVRRRYFNFYVLDGETGLYRPVFNEPVPDSLKDISIPSCRGCGACCMNFPEMSREKDDNYATWVGDDEEERFDGSTVEGTVNGDKSVRLKYDGKGRCVFLDGKNECAIYSGRPRICRTFERGSNDCLTHLSIEKRKEEKR